MSLFLERSGVNVSTCVRGHNDGSSPQFLEMYGKGMKAVPMDQAVDIIRDRIDDPVSADSVCMKGLRSFIGSMRPVSRKTQPFGNVFVWLKPDQGEAFERAFIAAEGQPPVEVLNVEIDRQDFVAMVDYVMTNTCLTGGELGALGKDPRLSLVDDLRVAR